MVSTRKMVLTFAFAVTFALIPYQSWANVDTYEGGDALLAMCGAPSVKINDVDSGLLSMECNMYLKGAIDTFQQTIPDITSVTPYCLPHEFGQVRAGIYDWLHSHTERRSEAAPGLIFAALLAQFPCNK